jgi:hypothetical protein
MCKRVFSESSLIPHPWFVSPLIDRRKNQKETLAFPVRGSMNSDTAWLQLWRPLRLSETQIHIQDKSGKLRMVARVTIRDRSRTALVALLVDCNPWQRLPPPQTLHHPTGKTVMHPTDRAPPLLYICRGFLFDMRSESRGIFVKFLARYTGFNLHSKGLKGPQPNLS